MKFILGALKELWGLFVDDPGYSLAIGVWVALVAIVLPRLPFPPVADGPILFAGLLAILIENVWRTARRRR